MDDLFGEYRQERPALYERRSFFQSRRSTRWSIEDSDTSLFKVHHHPLKNRRRTTYIRPNLNKWFVDTRPVLEHAVYFRIHDINVKIALNLPKKPKRIRPQQQVSRSISVATQDWRASIFPIRPSFSVYYEAQEREMMSTTRARASFLNKAVERYHKEDEQKQRLQEAKEKLRMEDLEAEVKKLDSMDARDVFNPKYGQDKKVQFALKNNTSLFETLMEYGKLKSHGGHGRGFNENRENLGGPKPVGAVDQQSSKSKLGQAPPKSVLKPKIKNQSSNTNSSNGSFHSASSLIKLPTRPKKVKKFTASDDVSSSGSFHSASEMSDTTFNSIVNIYNSSKNINQNADTEDQIQRQGHDEGDDENELKYKLTTQIEEVTNQISDLMEENAELQQSVMSARTHLTEIKYPSQTAIQHIPEPSRNITTATTYILHKDFTPFKLLIYIVAYALGFTLSIICS